MTVVTGGQFTNTFVISDESLQMRSLKHDEAWPKFKCEMKRPSTSCALSFFFFRIHFSARAGKAMHSRQQQDIPLLDRIDVIPAHDWPKHASLHVNCLDDVVAR
jgi:hypothetical protein